MKGFQSNLLEGTKKNDGTNIPFGGIQLTFLSVMAKRLVDPRGSLAKANYGDFGCDLRSSISFRNSAKSKPEPVKAKSLTVGWLNLELVTNFSEDGVHRPNSTL